MSLPTSFPAAVIETILTRLAALFLAGAGGDTAAARQAASQILFAYHPETEEELCLAANIVCFSFQALEALGQSASPEMSLTRVVRLRGGAVSLSREANKARRSLTRLQHARQQEQPAAPAPEPTADPAPRPVPPNTKPLTWTQAYQQKQRDRRLAARQKRAEANAVARPAFAPHGANAGDTRPIENDAMLAGLQQHSQA